MSIYLLFSSYYSYFAIYTTKKVERTTYHVLHMNILSSKLMQSVHSRFLSFYLPQNLSPRYNTDVFNVYMCGRSKIDRCKTQLYADMLQRISIFTYAKSIQMMKGTGRLQCILQHEQSKWVSNRHP